jgi:hypothetical protein
VIAERIVEDARFVCVVSSAAKLYVADGRPAADGIGLNMMELQKPRGVAPVPSRRDERTTATVALPDAAPHVGRNLA